MRIHFTISEVLTLVVFCCFPPCHPTAAIMTLDGILDEIEKSLQDLGESTPVNCAWDTQIYTANQGPEPEPDLDLFMGGAGGDDDDDGGAGGGGGGGESEGAGGGLDWTVGRFAVFPMDSSNLVPLLVGKIVEFRVGEEGKEAIIVWWLPVRKNVARSKYGKGVWSTDFLQNEPSAPDQNTQSADAACMTLSKWNASFHLLTAVLDTVNDQVPPPEDECEEGQDKQQTGEDKRGAAALEPGTTGPASGVRVGEQPAEPLALPTPPILEPPRGMQITAAFHRPHRNEYKC